MMALSKALGMDLPALAEMLRAKGRNKDSILAHISPKEAALLKRHGGSGAANPNTGLPEFDDGTGFGDVYAPQVDSGGQVQAPVASAPDYTPAIPPSQVTPDQPVSPVYDVAGPQGQFTSYQGGSAAQPGVAAVPPTQVGQPFSPGTNLPAPPPGVVSPDQQATAPTKPDQPSWTDKLTKAITDPNTLARLGLTAGLGAFGASQARKAGAQTQAATAEQKAIAQPYTQQGQQLVAQAQQGTLSAASQQALDAAKAQINQSTANRGGVGAQQAANQVANLYQSLIDNQYKYGLQIMQIGDNITLGAIKSGLQLDQQLQTTTNNFYSQLASIAAGGSGYIPAAPALQTQGIK